MTDPSANKRIDSGARVIKAPPDKIYQAFLDPGAIASWRPPEGMSCEIYEFHPYEGGKYRMSFGYNDTDHQVRGKTTEHADVFEGQFLELVPGQKIVELVSFESDDPAFAGGMKVSTLLKPVPGGTEVTILCENVPEGIRPEDHQAGINSTLKNLAAFTE